MSKYLIEETTLVNIADAVREYEGTADLIKVSTLKDRIRTRTTEVNGFLDELIGAIRNGGDEE